MKRTVFAFLLIISIALSCNRINSKNENAEKQSVKVESFDEFIDKFYSDTVFQQSRIEKPLKGEILEWHETEDSVVSSKWSDRELIFVTDYETLKNSFKNAKQSFMDNSESKIEKIQVENSGFNIEREFNLVNGKWFLVRYDISNL